MALNGRWELGGCMGTTEGVVASGVVGALSIVPGAGRFVIEDAPEEVVEMLTGFFATSRVGS